MEPGFKLSQKLIEAMIEQIKFPFAALGLIADNYLSFSASFIDFHYFLYR
jgi:hypothetical protein